MSKLIPAAFTVIVSPTNVNVYITPFALSASHTKLPLLLATR
jgi:hypothetical protein